MSEFYATVYGEKTDVFSLSRNGVSGLFGNAGMDREYLGRSTVLSVSELVTAAYLGQTQISSLSGISISVLFVNTGVVKDYLGPSAIVSHSAVTVSGLYGRSDLVEISMGFIHSSVVAKISELSSGSSMTIRVGVDDSRSNVLVSVGDADFPANADSASGASTSAALGVGLGLGLLVLILVMSGVLFWFFTRRRDETDVTQQDELAADSSDLPDAWAEHMILASGENALASEGQIVDVPFMDAGIMEEGLWISPTAN
jgi:hypothetical protein